MLTQIITPEKIEYSADVDQVTLPGVNGQITILPRHADLVCALDAGEVIVSHQNIETSFFISEGCAQISHNEITILADLSDQAASLTEARVQEAKAAAVQAKESRVDNFEFATIEANLRRELAKEKIIQKYKQKFKTVG